MNKLKIKKGLLVIILLTFSLLGLAQQPSPQMQAANQLVRAQKWAEAATALEEITKTEPNNGRAWFLLGNSYHQLGKYEKAAEAYEKNIPISKNPTAMYNLACAYSRLKQTDKAFEWLEKSLKNGVAPTVNIKTDEDLANLRSDSRFSKMEDIAARAVKPCLFSPEARQFDFWLGEWDVFPSQAPPGQSPKVGDSKIDQISEGCGLLENWTSVGNNGKSVNYYDSTTQKWYQHWIGSGGGALRYEGSFKDNAMRFEGFTIALDGKKTLQKLTFFKVDENTVRQLAEISTDEGKTWNTNYDFRYVRKVEKISVMPAKVESTSSTTGGIISNTIEVPKGTTITVDGKINEDEWKDALTHDLKGGGKLKLKHDGETLNIGLQGGKAGLSHVYLTDGQSIFVLHASAALGMAIYRKDGNLWQPTQKFKWELRDQATNNEASSAYLKTNNWLANVATTAQTTEREYKIAAKFKDGKNFRLAIAYLGNPLAPQFFPETLADDTLKRELLFGTESANLNFKKEQWATLKLKEK